MTVWGVSVVTELERSGICLHLRGYPGEPVVPRGAAGVSLVFLWVVVIDRSGFASSFPRDQEMCFLSQDVSFLSRFYTLHHSEVSRLEGEVT